MNPSRRTSLRILPLLVLLLLSELGAARSHPLDRSHAWSALSEGLPSRGIQVVAVQREGERDLPGERWAVGTDREVFFSMGSGAAGHSRVRGGVSALYFGEESLWVGSPSGLTEIDSAGNARAFQLDPGRAGGVRHLAGHGGWVAVGSERGLLLRAPGQEQFRPVGHPLPLGPVSALAFQPEDRLGKDPAQSLWVVVDEQLFRLRGLADHESFQCIPFESPRPGGGAEVRQLVPHPGGLLLLTNAELHLLDAGHFREIPLDLPPGAAATGLAAGAGGWWLTTDRGLLTAADPSGPWRVSSGPVAGQALSDLDASGDVLLVAGERGAFRTPPASRESSPDAPRPGAAGLAPGGPDDPVREPEIRAVQRAALLYQGLSTGRVEALARGVRRRAWLPFVELRADRGTDALSERDSDAVVSSGTLYRLEDRTRDSHRDLDVALVLRWDLGGVAYHPEAIDVSKERRELIELRDEVLDEVSQLYFDRLRVLSELSGNPQEDAARKLRAAQLASGLDAWTGGWWSEALGRLQAHP